MKTMTVHIDDCVIKHVTENTSGWKLACAIIQIGDKILTAINNRESEVTIERNDSQN